MRPLSPGPVEAIGCLWEGGRHSRGAQEHRGDLQIHSCTPGPCADGKMLQPPSLPASAPIRTGSGAPRQIPGCSSSSSQKRVCFLSDFQFTGPRPQNPAHTGTRACVQNGCVHTGTHAGICKEPSAHNTDAHRRRHAHTGTQTRPHSAHMLPPSVLGTPCLGPPRPCWHSSTSSWVGGQQGPTVLRSGFPKPAVEDEQESSLPIAQMGKQRGLESAQRVWAGAASAPNYSTGVDCEPK